ncbi:MAG: hypothetical protein ACKV2T_24415 [Kofleriaceae bacterium]
MEGEHDRCEQEAGGPATQDKDSSERDRRQREREVEHVLAVSFA